jgi:hypothetical protein
MRRSKFIFLLWLAISSLVGCGLLVAAEPLEKAEASLLKQYEKKLAAIVADADAGCIDCHSSQTMSNLVLTGDTLRDLRHLLDDGYLKSTGPDTLLGRLKNAHADRHMPKDAEPWNRKQLRQLERFLERVSQQEISSGIAADERFPRSLLMAATATGSSSPPTQFLSYRQLRGKIQTIFEDDWVRGDRDLFAENVAALGGADFKTRFNESTEPSASYLSALEVLSRDVASRAYRQQLGPFSQWTEPSWAAADGAATELESSIRTVYQRVLFRSPTSAEMQQALELLQGVQDLESSISERNTELVFEVTVTDPVTGMSGQETIMIPVSGERLGLRQTIVDQTVAGQGECVLGRLRLEPGSPARVVVHNQGTFRNVSFAGIELRDAQGQVVHSIAVDTAAVFVDGAWTREDRKELKVLADKNQHKGLSTLVVTLDGPTSGQFDVVAKWLPDERNADNVLFELFGPMEDVTLAAPQRFATHAPGAGLFYFDCSNDTVPFVELPGVFQFGQEDWIELSNQGTLDQVTAGGMEFLNQSDANNTFLIDSADAEGVDQWEKFDEGRFRAYNVQGQKVHDNNQRKGELALRYQLVRSQAAGWRETDFYRVRVYYPGKRDQETRVPVRVQAQRSSPIVQVSYPLQARADAVLRLDASHSYTVHGAPLEYRWRQVAGPAVEISDPSLACLEIRAPRQSSRELAWVSLVGGLIRHPDFLFTHAPSCETSVGLERQQMLLAKLTLDLLGRAPTPAELDRLAQGAGLEHLVDSFLDSAEFRDFYFHRVRLYMESQGTSLQDEPARLWSYIAFNDRPFQEILTAEYTVDENFQRLSRPDYHGKTGVLTTKGFIDGKPGLPHYNYAAQVSMLFLGYVYEVPPEIVEQREGVTALGTADPNSSCYSCHKILTPLSFQRLNWTDAGEYRTTDEDGLAIDATDQAVVDEYPFKGNGLEAFATQAVKKERFVRTIINTHVDFYFGRQMDHRDQERALYKRLWDHVHGHDFKLRSLIKAIVTSPEYLGLELQQLATK